MAEKIIDIIIGTLDAFGSFLAFGQEKLDGIKSWLTKYGGDEAGEAFDGLLGGLTNLFNAVVIVGSIFALGAGTRPDVKGKGGGRRGVTKGRGGQKPSRFKNPFRRSPVTVSGQPRRSGAPVSRGRPKPPRFRNPFGSSPRVTGGTRGLNVISRIKNFLGPIGGTILRPVFFLLDFFGRKGEGQTDVQAVAGAAAGTKGFTAAAGIAAKTLSPLVLAPFPGARFLYGFSVLGAGLLGAFGAAAITDKITGADKVGQYQESDEVKEPKKPSEGSKIAGELGRFMKKKGVVPGSIHRHPEHPPYSLTQGHYPGSLHYQGRAIDLGGYSGEQKPILDAVMEFNKLKGISPVEFLHADNDVTGDHDNHVHVAYKKGGLTKSGAHMATLGEEGREFVIDNDSYTAIEGAFPGLLATINAAKGKSAIEAVMAYTDYEKPPEPEMAIMGGGSGGGSGSYGGSGESGMVSSNVSEGSSGTNSGWKDIRYKFG